MTRKQMNSADIFFFLKENDLSGAKIEKLYHKKGEVVMRLYKERKIILRITKKFLSIVNEFSSDSADTFTMTMRKHIYGRVDVVQHGFDRIVEFVDHGTLVCEMFRNGNFIILDENRTIVLPEEIQKWKGRTIRPSEEYKYPPGASILDKGAFLDEFSKSDKSVASFLGMRGFGIYGEEICQSAGIDKNSKCKDVDAEKIYDELMAFLNRPLKPNLIYDSGKLIDFSPVELSIYDGYEKKYVKTFSDAINEFFADDVEEKVSSVDRIREEKLKKYEELERELLDTAVFIQENIDYIEFFIKSLGGRVKGMKKLKINVNGRNITIDPSKSLMKNVSNYYERAKEVKNKIEKIKSLQSEKKKSSEPTGTSENDGGTFRTFTTSDGFKVIAGKDAETNEILVKKHLDKWDIVFHADIVGAPFTVIKSGKKLPSAQAIKEAAQFAACYSRAWKRRLGTIDVYWVHPNQVKKVPGLPKGSFQIQGKRNYLRNVELKLCFIPIKGVINVLPLEATKVSDKKYVAFGPGTTKAKELVSAVRKEFNGYQIPQNLSEKIPYGEGDIIR